MKKIIMLMVTIIGMAASTNIFAMADKVANAIQEKKYTQTDLKKWYDAGSLVRQTHGAITKADYEAYLARIKQRPLPPPPAIVQKAQVVIVSDAKKQALVNDLARAFLRIWDAADPINNPEGSELFLHEILEKAEEKAKAEYFKKLFGRALTKEELE